VGSPRQGLPLRHRERCDHARRAVRRPLAAARVPLHARPRLGGGLPELLVGRRRLRHDVPAPAEPRRGVHRRVAGAAAEAARVPGPDGVELPVGVVVGQRLQLRLPRDDRPVGHTRRVQLPRPGPARAGQRRVARLVGRAARHERVRAGGRRRLPHLLRVRAWPRRSLAHVAVARPGTAGPQRGRHVVVPPPRRVRGGRTAVTRSRRRSAAPGPWRRRPERSAARR